MLTKLKTWWLRYRLNSVIDDLAVLNQNIEEAMKDVQSRRRFLQRKQSKIRSELAKLETLA